MTSSRPGLEPHTLTVMLGSGQMLVLEREALWAAPQAGSDHLQLRRASDGEWWLVNIAPDKRGLRSLLPAVTYRCLL